MDNAGTGAYRQGLSSNMGPPALPPTSGRRGEWTRMAAWQTCSPASDYKCFNSSNVSIRPWSWNYRSCWHQTCPPVDTHHWVWIASITSSAHHKDKLNCYSSLLPRHEVSQHWAICVPAAHLGSGSRLSGSLSGVEP